MKITSSLNGRSTELDIQVHAEIGTPSATITATPQVGFAPLEVAFETNGSGANWLFGDGTQGAGQTLSHVYTEPGVYTVTVMTTLGEASTDIEVIAPYTISYTSSTLFYPIALLNDEQYSSIVMRGMQNPWPTVMYDDGNYPLRTLSFWPVPTEVNAVELWLWEPLLTYADLDAELNLPPGYERYLRFKLAVEIAAEFGKEVPGLVLKNLEEAESNIKKLNQTHPVQTMSLGARSVSRQGRQWTILDTYSGGDVLPWRP